MTDRTSKGSHHNVHIFRITLLYRIHSNLLSKPSDEFIANEKNTSLNYEIYPIGIFATLDIRTS